MIHMDIKWNSKVRGDIEFIISYGKILGRIRKGLISRVNVHKNHPSVKMALPYIFTVPKGLLIHAVKYTKKQYNFMDVKEKKNLDKLKNISIISNVVDSNNYKTEKLLVEMEWKIDHLSKARYEAPTTFIEGDILFELEVLPNMSEIRYLEPAEIPANSEAHLIDITDHAIYASGSREFDNLTIKHMEICDICKKMEGTPTHWKNDTKDFVANYWKGVGDIKPETCKNPIRHGCNLNQRKNARLNRNW